MDSSTINPDFDSFPSFAPPTSNDDDHIESFPDPDEDFILLPEENEKNASTHFHPGVTKPGSPQVVKEEEFILGTIFVRVVAAKSLVNPNQSGKGFGGVFRNNPPSVNSYASVKFGNTTQRTSDVYSSLNPVWPRNEGFFMDVSLPVSQLTHSLETSVPDANTSYAVHKDPYFNYKKPENTALTVALFHSEIGNVNRKLKSFDEKKISGDSNDTFLGMASVDLTRLLTGKVPEFDEWVPLTGTSTDHDRKGGSMVSSVRIMCEYEVADIPPKVGDICRFTRFCHPKDLYPLEPARSYRVDQVQDDGNIILLSYESQERWFLTFQAHKNMLICEERHVSALNTAQDELQTIGERLSISPLVTTLTETAERVVDDGVVGIANGLLRGSAFVFDRWFKGGVDVIIHDIQDITNFDGRHSVDRVGQHLDLNDPDDSASSVASDDNEEIPMIENEVEALPNMPSCPITGFPMVDPVVAADGHTYERTAITRWLKTSNKSPMTGSVLLHKELVPNYGLLSSVQEVTAREKEDLSGLDDK